MTITCDVAVYGDHWGAVLAAVASARKGARTVLFSDTVNIGTPLVAGLGVIDIGAGGSKGIGTWLLYETFNRISSYLGWNGVIRRITPSIAEQVFSDMLRQSGVYLKVGSAISSVAHSGTSITTVTLADTTVISATNYIDASEDGNLMVAAGLTATIAGREAAATYSETLAGYFPRTATFQEVDTSDGMGGLIFGVNNPPVSSPGDADLGVQTYGFRLSLTANPNNQLNWPLPSGYDPTLFELFRRRSPIDSNDFQPFNILGHTAEGKIDANSDVGTAIQWGWPNGNAATKASLFQTMYNQWAGWLWFCANDPSVSSGTRQFMDTWRPSADEFQFAGTTTGGWPKQIYRRGVLRIANPATRMTQADIQTAVTKTDSIGTGWYTPDCHTVQFITATSGPLSGIVTDSFGTLPLGVASGRYVVPYQIPYSCTYSTECANLLVPNCAGASFVAMSSMRIDMWKANVAAACGYAAAKSVLTSTAMQSLTVADLQADLVALGQVITPP